MLSSGLHLPRIILTTIFWCSPHRRACLLHKHDLKRAIVMISRTAAANSLHTDLQNLCKAIKTFADAKPSVTGSERLLKRAQRDCSYVDSLLEVAGEFTSSASVMKHLDASPSRDLHGVRNNLRGLQAELDLACQAEAVVCLGAKFYSNVSAGVYCFKSIISILQRTESMALAMVVLAT